MTGMIDFCTAILGAICDFLIEPPIFYLFSLMLRPRGRRDLKGVSNNPSAIRFAP